MPRFGPNVSVGAIVMGWRLPAPSMATNIGMALLPFVKGDKLFRFHEPWGFPRKSSFHSWPWRSPAYRYVTAPEKLVRTVKLARPEGNELSVVMTGKLTLK